MTNLKQIIIDKRLKLGDSFTDIKQRINTNRKRYAGLNIGENELVYHTERIYPKHSKHRQRIPVLFLFSNPHPESVKKGLFLSGPHSRTFWQRLSEIDKNYLQLPPGAVNLERWDESIPGLREIMLRGDYKSPFLLYFHCLWPIPTRQVRDLKELFNSKSKLWAEVERSGREELDRLIKDEQIKHIVVFSSELFRVITRANKNEVRKWRDKVQCALGEFQRDGDKDKYWRVLSSGYVKKKFNSNDMEIYLGLNTRAKNVWNEAKTQRYFTLALDMIFTKIKETI